MKIYDQSFHAFIQGVILIGFALLILGLILSGNIVYYIAPTMMPFIYFALGTFFLLGIVQVFRSTKKEDDHAHTSCNCEHEHQIRGPLWLQIGIYSIFILPVVLGFSFPDRGLDSSVAANRGIQFGSGISTNSEIAEHGSQSSKEKAETEENEGTSRAEAYLEDPDEYMESLGASSNQSDIEEEDHYQIEDLYDEEWFDEYYIELAEEMLEEDHVQVTEKNYLDVMTVLDLYLDDFIGKEIEIMGFAYREPDFEEDQVVAARFSMTCCTADASVYGTLIESEEASQFDDDTWILASGTIERGDYHGQSVPKITDAFIQEIEEPASPYVYPSY
ncbi:TIGR03943 family protein [Salipaludibacillus keqinensis]|uniref:TIGR03943 family protein n=1 Tax=Salipaludibacillus keqinensis TaxID=2045207 RepID=A0A323TH21_9BACI|nr:TIGR03943 family protein [Salipaludibacillus keqinensis]PYZ94422.1 TIGR03943 family protein [Salipaludibacillus keqinensis]